MVNRDRQIAGNVYELDNEGVNAADCTIMFYFGTNDDGERYVDAQMVTGHVQIYGQQDHKDIASIIGAEDLIEALDMLIEEIE